MKKNTKQAAKKFLAEKFAKDLMFKNAEEIKGRELGKGYGSATKGDFEKQVMINNFEAQKFTNKQK